MAHHSFWQYLKLKVIAVLIRFINYIGTRRHFIPSDTCIRRKVRLPSHDPGRFIDAWIYSPPQYNEREPQRLVINWHGGGFMLPNLGMDHGFCERVARETGSLVLDVDYRKGPEHVFPSGIDDAEDALRWVQSQPRVFDLNRIALSGFSSGATVALVASSELRQDFPNVKIRAVYAFYPLVDFSISPEARLVAQPIRPLPVFMQHVFTDSYVPRVEDRKSPKASPLYAKPSSFPETVILFACSGDILSPEAVALGQKLQQAGCGVETVLVNDASHGFDKTINPRTFKPKERDETYDKVIESLRGII